MPIWPGRRGGRAAKPAAGAGPDQAGVLSLRPCGAGKLRARPRVIGREFEESVGRGHDIAAWIKGLEPFVGVTARGSAEPCGAGSAIGLRQTLS